MSNKRIYLTDNPHLMSEFDYEKNIDIDVSKITSGSHLKLWWKCSLGHSWNAAVSKRFIGQNCPFCSGKRALKGYNDLSTTNPELVSEWDSAKNDTPIFEYRPMSNKKVWWTCDKGHHWEAVIAKRAQGEKCPICQGKTVQTGFNDLCTTHTSLIEEWDFEKNSGLSPYKFSKGSDKKVWWRCKHNHSWEATISSRVSGVACPQCAKELQISYPEKALYYYTKKVFPDATANYKLTDEMNALELDIFIPSFRVGIEYDGERWHQDIERDLQKNRKCAEQDIFLIRVREPLCPVLSDSSSLNILLGNKKRGLHGAIETVINALLKHTGKASSIRVDLQRDNADILSLLVSFEKANSLHVLYPDIAMEWDVNKNGKLNATLVSNGSDKKVWWICPLGHSYLSSISARTRGRSCPICAGKQVLKGFNDFESQYPLLAKEWDYEKNRITPDAVAYGSDKKYWWICENRHSYSCSINNRRAGQGCSYCSGKKVLQGFNDIATTHPDIAQQWCAELNDVNPTEVNAGSHKKVWWECSVCGHRWVSSIYNRCLNKAECPKCSGRSK